MTAAALTHLTHLATVSAEAADYPRAVAPSVAGIVEDASRAAACAARLEARAEAAVA
jgi:hypothetical protein